MPVGLICAAPLGSRFLFLGDPCWAEIRWQRFKFPAASHTSSSAWAEQQLDVYLTHRGWEASRTHPETFKGGSPFSNRMLWWWWWWSPPWVVLSLCSGCRSRRFSFVGRLWSNVRMPSPPCSWRAARPERPLSDTATDTVQVDSLQAEGHIDDPPAAEQDGGDMSES